MLRVRSGVLLAVMLAAVWSVAGSAVQRTGTPRAIRELRVKQWIDLVRQHEPGGMDAALRSLQTWPDAQLQQLASGLIDAFSPTGQSPAGSSEEQRRLIRRGAVMHADLAMLARFHDAPADTPKRSPMAPASVIVDDGQPTGFAANSMHWEIGRLLIDLLEPEHLRDAFGSLW